MNLKKTLPAESGENSENEPALFDDSQLKIFLVDDNELYLKSLEIQFLENKNIIVKTFLTGESCIKYLAFKPDIIILDYYLNGTNMDAMDGLKTLSFIKENSKGIEVIVVSGNESPEIAVNCIKQGATDYVVKDVKTFFKLKQSIKKILGHSSKEKELMVWDW